MTYEYHIYRKRVVFVLLLLVLTLVFFHWAYVDPAPSTSSYSLTKHAGNYYLSTYVDLRPGSKVELSPDQLLETLHVIIIPESSRSTIDVTHYYNYTSSYQLTASGLSYTASKTSSYHLIIFGDDTSQPSLSLHLTLDLTPFSTTTTYSILVFSIGLGWFTLLLLLQKDLRYSWRYVRARLGGKQIESKSFATEDDMLDTLFGTRNNLETISTSDTGSEDDLYPHNDTGA